MSRRYSSWALVDLAEHAVQQHFGEPDHRVERCPQFVRHVRQDSDSLAGALGSTVLGLQLTEKRALTMANADWPAKALEQLPHLLAGKSPVVRRLITRTPTSLVASTA